MAEIPTLYVCHGDDGGPRVHPCRRVQEAMRAADIEYEKVVAAHGARSRSCARARARTCARRREHEAARAQAAGGTVFTHSKQILAWISEQPERRWGLRCAPGKPRTSATPTKGGAMAGRADQMRQRYKEFGEGNLEAALQDWADDFTSEGSKRPTCPAAASTTGRKRRSRCSGRPSAPGTASS